MRRRVLLGALAFAATTAEAWGEIRPGKRIGVLFPGNLGPRRLELITSGVRSIASDDPPDIDARSAEGNVQQLRRMASEFVQRRVDAILAIGSISLHTAHSETRTLPIVALDLETDPVANGLVTSWSRPGGNVTGIFFDAPEVAGKWFQLLRDILPHVSVVGLLFDTQTDQGQVKAAEHAARAFGAATLRLPVSDPDGFVPAFNAAIERHVEALIVHSSPIFVDNARRIGLLALEHRLPSVALFPISAATGALIAYGPDNFALLPLAGATAARVALGANPAELPIQRPSLYKLVVNLRTASALGLKVPDSLTAIADEVIE